MTSPPLSLSVFLCATLTGCYSPEVTWRQSYGSLAKNSPSKAELDLIKRTGLPFGPSARLLYHLVIEQEGYEEWLLICPTGTHPVKGKALISIDPEADRNFIASQAGTDDIGAMPEDGPLPSSYHWDSKGHWYAKILPTDRGDYVLIQHKWQEVRRGGHWANADAGE